MPSLADLEILKSRYNYDPETGALTAARQYNKRIVVGERIVSDYIGLSKRKIVRARAVWAIINNAWPPDNLIVEHKDRNHQNDRKGNLRLATKAQNAYNMESRRNGPRGVYQVGQRWAARIYDNGKAIHLGCFATEDEAAQAYRDVANVLHGEFLCQA